MPKQYTQPVKSASVLWDENLIHRYDLSGPRYTSYPTAPQFKETFTFNQWRRAMIRSNASKRSLPIYIHIPFCDTVCYYCGCNKIITANKNHALPYLNGLHKEVAMQAKNVDSTRLVRQLHWGGGTPTYISDCQMSELMAVTSKHFRLLNDDSGEYSIEIHPQSVNPTRMQRLRLLGFNRISLGIQDFDPRVQAAVNRFNSEKEVNVLVQAARKLDFHSISMDLIYGLPKQTVSTFKETLTKVINMRPDRLSLFNYAHMPHIFKVQKQINTNDLPRVQEKLKMLHGSIEHLLSAGYVYIGMDHFALPEDKLSIAQEQGKLQRNFQGYATHGDCDLLAFGVSAINFVGNTFAQNHKNMNSYIQSISQNNLPLAKGIELTEDDLIRRSVINQLICHFQLTFGQIERNWGVVFNEYFSSELLDLKNLAQDGLVVLDESGIKVPDAGRLLIRRICMVFDVYLQKQARNNDLEKGRYSRII